MRSFGGESIFARGRQAHSVWGSSAGLVTSVPTVTISCLLLKEYSIFLWEKNPHAYRTITVAPFVRYTVMYQWNVRRDSLQGQFSILIFFFLFMWRDSVVMLSLLEMTSHIAPEISRVHDRWSQRKHDNFVRDMGWLAISGYLVVTHLIRFLWNRENLSHASMFKDFPSNPQVTPRVLLVWWRVL